ncbi:MAG: ATP-binding cassette domain-containing protein [Chthonomonas sp.]|nr:ATP-binding cassette domain-containing protein [Chthonomonas sp.]
MAIIRASNLAKSFFTVKKAPGLAGAVKSLFWRERNEIQAVKGVSLEIKEGELVGFLGPNGAGKTTTIKMLAGILFPSGGEAEVLGYKPFDRRPEMLREISLVMGNKQQLWWDLPAWDSFVMYRELYDIDRKVFDQRAERLIAALDLGEKVNTQVRKMSLGERMKCELVAALLHQPRVIFLDEPTIGLDLVSQQRIREFLLELNRNDRCTIMLTSHYMQDVKELAERVIIIDHGVKLFDDTLDKLTAAHSSERHLRLTFSHEVDPQTLAPYGTLREETSTSAVLAIEPQQVPTATAAILANFPVADIAIEEVSLDEIIRQVFSTKPEGSK